MLQNPCKTLGFMKNMVYKILPGGGGKPYPASGLSGDCSEKQHLKGASYLRCTSVQTDELLFAIIREETSNLHRYK